MQVTNDSKSKIDEKQLSKLIDRKIREELAKRMMNNDDGFLLRRWSFACYSRREFVSTKCFNTSLKDK